MEISFTLPNRDPVSEFSLLFACQFPMEFLLSVYVFSSLSHFFQFNLLRFFAIICKIDNHISKECETSTRQVDIHEKSFNNFFQNHMIYFKYLYTMHVYTDKQISEQMATWFIDK